MTATEGRVLITGDGQGFHPMQFVVSGWNGMVSMGYRPEGNSFSGTSLTPATPAEARMLAGVLLSAADAAEKGDAR